MKKLSSCGFYVFVACAVIAIVSLYVRWSELDALYRLMHIFLIGLCLHQIEEHHLPGGFDFGYNFLHLVGKKRPGDARNARRPNIDRYPANRLSFFLVDVMADLLVLAFVLLAANPVTATFCALFGLFEALTHTAVGALMLSSFKEKGKETIYNPGAATSWFVLLPVGILSLYEVVSRGLVQGAEWGAVLALLVAFMALVIQLPERALMDPESPYAFGQKNFEGYYAKYLD